MRLVIAGGSGQVGTVLVRALARDGHEVVVLSRSASRRGARRAPSRGTPARSGAWAAEIDGADVVINLAGRSVNCRYTPANRAAILDSRVDSTRVVGEAIAARRAPAARLAAGEHGDDLRAPLRRAPTTRRPASSAAASRTRRTRGASASTSRRAWERALRRGRRPPRHAQGRVRSAMIMSPDRGGIFDTLLGLVRRGLGGPAGDGRQYISWIHDEDFVRAVRGWSTATRSPARSTSPPPTRSPTASSCARCAAPADARIGLPATKLMLEAGAFLLRTETELILKSRRVVPGLLLEHGFEFAYPALGRGCATALRRRAQSGKRCYQSTAISYPDSASSALTIGTPRSRA